jgi:hypothetical protein
MSFIRISGLVAITSLSASLCFGSLRLVSNDELSGQGVGAVATVIVVQDGNEQNLVGCIGRDASGTADVKGATFTGSTGGTGGCVGSDDAVQNGSSQTLRFDDNKLQFGATSDASQIGVVYNSAQAQNSTGEITLFDLVLRIYAPDGTILFTSSGVKDSDGNLIDADLIPGITLDPDEAGTGGSGFLFKLDAAQVALANAAFTAGGGFDAGNRFAVSVNTGCAGPQTATCVENSGGPETVNIVNLGEPSGGGEVPEPATFALMGVALAGVALYRRRQNSVN